MSNDSLWLNIINEAKLNPEWRSPAPTLQGKILGQKLSKKMVRANLLTCERV